MKNIINELKNIKIIFYDFDGVMTDNRAILHANGTESVFVNRGDGLGVKEIKKLGINQIIVSTEINDIVKKRAEKLKIDSINGVVDKKKIIENYCLSNNFSLKNAMFIGNDLNDFEAMKIVNLKGCPCDAEEEIISISDWVSKSKGGYGVIRELYRLLQKMKVGGND